MTTAVAGATTPMTPMENTDGDVIRLRPQNRIQRDIPRYVVFAGDLLPPLTKRGFRSFIGIGLGGAWFDPVAIPALWRFNGFISRGRLTPLIKRPTQAHASEELSRKRDRDIAEIVSAGGDVKEVPQAFRTAFPWDSLQSLQAPHIMRKGIVHVPALDGADWNTGDVQKIQEFFFPNWTELTTGAEEMSLLLADFVRHIETRRRDSADDVIQQVADAYLESASTFEQYAKSVADQAKRAFARGMNEMGYMAPITPFARHLAMQVGVTIDESPAEIAKQMVSAQTPSNGGDSALLEATLEQNKILTTMLTKFIGADEEKPKAKAKAKPAKEEAKEKAE